MDISNLVHANVPKKVPLDPDEYTSNKDSEKHHGGSKNQNTLQALVANTYQKLSEKEVLPGTFKKGKNDGPEGYLGYNDEKIQLLLQMLPVQTETGNTEDSRETSPKHRRKFDNSDALLPAVPPPDPSKQLAVEYNQSLTAQKAIDDIIPDESEDQSHPQMQNLHPSNVVSEENTEVKHYDTKLVDGPFLFSVDEKGCTVTAPYCKVVIPPGAVNDKIDVEMKPLYYDEATISQLGGQTLITPVVRFEHKCGDRNEINFNTDVLVSLHTSYSVVDPANPILVKILRKCGPDLQENFTSAVLRNEHYIHFRCRHFCRFGAHVAEGQHASLNRRYYSAAYTRYTPAKKTRIVHWMIYEDMPDTREYNLKYLDKRSTLVDPESLTVRCTDDLQIMLERSERRITVEPENCRISLVSLVGKKVDKKPQFQLDAQYDLGDTCVKLTYKIFGKHFQTRIVDELAVSHCFFIWNIGEGVPDNHNYTVNAIGEKSTGIAVEREHTQQVLSQMLTQVLSQMSLGQAGQMEATDENRHAGESLDALQATGIQHEGQSLGCISGGRRELEALGATVCADPAQEALPNTSSSSS